MNSTTSLKCVFAAVAVVFSALIQAGGVLASLALCICALTAQADGESLAETGGFVTTEAQLAFKDITLADLGTQYIPVATMTGAWVTAKDTPVSFCVRTVGDGVIRYQAQMIEGSVKAVLVEFTDGEAGDGVYVRASAAQGFYNGDLTKFGKDIYNESSTSAGDIATASGNGTYGLHNLRLVPAEQMRAICLNFNHTEATALTTTDVVGPSGYAVGGLLWSQMLGTNNNILNGVRLIGGEALDYFGEFPGATATVSKTRGTWQSDTYTAASDIRHGYIDEGYDGNSNYFGTPTVTLTGIPFAFYKVVFYASTDESDKRFGYVTINNVNYSSDNTDKNEGDGYTTVAGSASAWGKTQVSALQEGVNYLVSDVTCGDTLTVVGHGMSGPRGCIAAIQIINIGGRFIHGSAVTAAQINAVSTTGEPVYVWLDADATLTFDTALTASKVYLGSDGAVSLSAETQPSAEELAKLDLSAVKGSVLRSWLSAPGVVGFNFNADGGRNNGGSTDGCADTSLALESGTWYKDGHDASGSSTALFADGLSKLAWKSANVWAEQVNITDGTFIQGYLDDGQNVSVTLSAVPYATYDVIIYCSTDDSSKSFKAKTVNGTIYTWDATTGAVTTTTDENATWGLASAAAGKAVYGANTLRINGLTGPLSILGGTSGNSARGCISAIQIMPTGTSTAPEMRVGAAGETTAANWSTMSLWDAGRVATSGTAILNVEGDVTLTVDENISLSAVTVQGEGSLRLVTASGVTATIDSLSSPLPIKLADDTPTISTLSAPITYLYTTDSIVSSTLGQGNTYTKGVGGEADYKTITHNGGSVTLADGTYYLADSTSSTATTVTFRNATAIYSPILSLGMATYILAGTSSVTTPRIVLSNIANGRTANLILKDSASLIVTESYTADTNGGNMFGHYNGPTTFTIQDNAMFKAPGIILLGKTGNTQTINVNGGVFSVDGLKVSSAYGAGPNTVNLAGGVLELGTIGVDVFGSRVLSVNVNANSELRAKAATLPVTQPVTLGAGTTLSVTKTTDVEAATVTLSGAVSGSGDISIGAGVTLDIGTNRPEGLITVDATGTLAFVLASKVEVPVLKVSAKPSNLVVYDTDGTTQLALADDDIVYDAEAGTLTIRLPAVTWTKKEDASFDTVGNWSGGATPVNGQNATVQVSGEATDITVSGTYNLGFLAIKGDGDATVSAAGDGSITATAYDFSGATGRIEYRLPTGSAPVASGTDTHLPVGGSGAVTVGAGNAITLGAWGSVVDDTYTCDTTALSLASGSVLTFAPGEGKVQKLSAVLPNAIDTVVISNGTFVADKTSDGDGDGIFKGSKIRIENGGTLSLETVADSTGYAQTAPLTINEGGTFAVKMRDTLNRTINLNGGTITVQGKDGNRALDLYSNCSINVTKDSVIQGIAVDSEANPKIWFRPQNTTKTIAIADGARLVNNVTYASDSVQSGQSYGNVKILGSGANKTGRFVQNGFGDYPLTYAGTTTIGESDNAVTYELNATHTGNGAYTVANYSHLTGLGAIVGEGVVTLAGANTKVTGLLTIKNLAAAAGAKFGDGYSSVATTVTGSFTAGGTLAIENGTLAIGAACEVSVGGATVTVAADGGLTVGTAMAVSALTTAGATTIGVTRTDGVASAATLTVSGDATLSAGAAFVLDYGDEGRSRAGDKLKLLEVSGTLTLPEGGVKAITVSDASGRRWRLSVVAEDGKTVLYAEPNSALLIIVR